MLTAVGSVVPAAVAIVAPIALGFARRYKINPVLMGLMVVNGATAGGFSPISIFGSIVNGVVERNDLAGNPTLLFFSSLIFNTLLSVVVFFAVRRPRPAQPPRRHRARRRPSASSARRPRAGRRRSPAAPSTSPPRRPKLNRDRILTLVGIAALVLIALTLGIDWDVGFVAVTIAVILSLAMPHATKGAAEKVAWPTVLLICGIVTYVALLRDDGHDRLARREGRRRSARRCSPRC